VLRFWSSVSCYPKLGIITNGRDLRPQADSTEDADGTAVETRSEH
jgi:hypothetical protein